MRTSSIGRLQCIPPASSTSASDIVVGAETAEGLAGYGSLPDDDILLDEPGTYLDIAHQLELMELVKGLNKDKGMTVVMVLHDLNQGPATVTDC